MKAIIKLIGISLFLQSSFWISKEVIKPTVTTAYRITKDTTESTAYQILIRKCNVCRQIQNRRRVFTMENMNAWSKDIYKQVFIKTRMPKGRNIKLTKEEYQILQTWIKSNKN